MVVRCAWVCIDCIKAPAMVWNMFALASVLADGMAIEEVVEVMVGPDGGTSPLIKWGIERPVSATVPEWPEPEA